MFAKKIQSKNRLFELIEKLKATRNQFESSIIDAQDEYSEGLHGHGKFSKLLSSFDHLIEEVDTASQEAKDIEVILDATLEHNTEVENELTYERDKYVGESKKYEFIVNSSGDCMSLISKGYILEEVNRSFCKYFEKSRRQLIGKSIIDAWGENIFQEHFEKPINSTFQGNSRFFQIELKENKKRQCLDINCYPYYDRDDNVKHVVLIFRNITEKRDLEQQVIKAQRMESMGTLAGGIAHDLNNILAPFFMALRTLEPKLEHDKDAMKILNILGSSAQRGSELVKQILTFARGVEGEKCQLQLKYIINEIEYLFRQTFPKNISLSTDINPNLSLIIGDSTQLHQVLLNLCVNARDAMPDGGKITISADNVTLDRKTVMGARIEAGPYILIKVADTGTGIKKDIQNKIFEPFFTTKEFGKGTGIGLSTVMAVIRNHQGYVEVNSEIEKGTEFRLYIPALEEEIGEMKKPVIKDVILGSGAHILVVDDEQSIRDITKATLENYGYSVAVSANGRSAVKYFTKNMDKIDAVIMDIMMPIMDGATTISEIKKIKADIKVIGVTGMVLDDIRKEINIPKEDVELFLFKPYTGEILLKALAQVLKD